MHRPALGTQMAAVELDEPFPCQTSEPNIRGHLRFLHKALQTAGGIKIHFLQHIGRVQTSSEPRIQMQLDHSAQARLQLLADFSATLGLPGFDDASNSTHDVFKTVPSSSVARTVTIAISGQTLAVEAFCMDYQFSRGINGELAITVPMLLANGAVPTWA